MSAGQYNFKIEQGATFKRRLTWKNSGGTIINLTGWSARMQIKLSKSSAEKIISLTSDANGGITLGGDAGTIDILISATVTAGFTFNTAFYDLEMINPNGEVTRLLEGTVTLSREVTI